MLAFGHERPQRDLQIGARIAAEAAIAEQRDLVSAGAQQHVVNADAAELVDNDRGARALRCPQEVPNQRRFSGTEKAGDDRHRNARAASMLESASERAGMAGREQIEQRASREPHADPMMLTRKRSFP